MDKNILQLLKKGDSKAQKKVYYGHCDRLMNVAHKHLRSIPESEEALQDAFLNIFTKIGQFDPEKGSFEAWSRKIMINTALMNLRKKKNIVFLEKDLSQMSISDQTNTLDVKAENIDFDQYLNELPERLAIVFRLKVFEGYNHIEIAEILDIKSTNSRKLFSRARKKLSHYFNKVDTSI